MAADSSRGAAEPLNTRTRFSNRPHAEPSTRFANLALGLDAGFCNVVGLAFVLIGALVAEKLGVSGWSATVFGIVVLLWSFQVTLYANRKISRYAEVLRVIRANAVIVVLGLVLLLWPGSMTMAGKIWLAIFTGVTAAFAAAQLVALRTLPQQ